MLEPEQASLLKESFNWIKGASSNLGIENVTWYNLQDWPSEGHWAGFCGLRRENGSFRPAWFAFQEETGAPRWPVERPHVSFADAANSNSVTNWTYGNEGHWGQLPLSGDEVAKGTHPSAMIINGLPHVFFVDATKGNTISFWSWNSGSGWQLTQLGGDKVAAGSSPSAAILNGSPHVFFSDATQGNSMAAWIWNAERRAGDSCASSATKWQKAPVPRPCRSANNNPHVFFVDATQGNSIGRLDLEPEHELGAAALLRRRSRGRDQPIGGDPQRIPARLLQRRDRRRTP